jgi:hypothetical protein
MVYLPEFLHEGEEKRIGDSYYPEVTCQRKTAPEYIHLKEKSRKCD